MSYAKIMSNVYFLRGKKKNKVRPLLQCFFLPLVVVFAFALLDLRRCVTIALQLLMRQAAGSVPPGTYTRGNDAASTLRIKASLPVTFSLEAGTHVVQ